MGPREAALAVELLGVDAVAPIHLGTFPILAGTPGTAAGGAGHRRGLRDVAVHGWAPGGSLREEGGTHAPVSVPSSLTTSARVVDSDDHHRVCCLVVLVDDEHPGPGTENHPEPTPLSSQALPNLGMMRAGRSMNALGRGCWRGRCSC